MIKINGRAIISRVKINLLDKQGKPRLLKDNKKQILFKHN